MYKEIEVNKCMALIFILPFSHLSYQIRVLSMLDHPNIISYYDSFEEDGTLMIEMEYADGGTLAEYLSSSQGKREIEEQEILALFQQMVAGIRHIHEHKILHR